MSSGETISLVAPFVRLQLFGVSTPGAMREASQQHGHVRVSFQTRQAVTVKMMRTFPEDKLLVTKTAKTSPVAQRPKDQRKPTHRCLPASSPHPWLHLSRPSFLLQNDEMEILFNFIVVTVTVIHLQHA